LININITLLIQIVNFVVLLLILNAILYKPIMAKLSEREARIQGDRDKTRALEEQVEEQETRHQEELGKARQTAAQEKNALLQEAKKKEAGLLEKAREEAGRILEDMKESIRKEADEARTTLKAEMTPLAQSIAEKILGRPVS